MVIGISLVVMGSGMLLPAGTQNDGKSGEAARRAGRRRPGAQAGISGERAAELGEVLSGEAPDEHPGGADSGITLPARWLRGVVMKPL